MFDVNKFFDAKRVVNEHTTETDAKSQDRDEKYYQKNVASEVFPESDTNNTQLVPLFAQPLLMTRLAKKYIDSMEDVVKYESENQQQNLTIHSGRNCYQSNEDLHVRHEAVRILNNKIEEIIRENFGLDVEIKDSWLNVNSQGGFNYEHTHAGIISGCFYVHVPEGSGDIVFHNPAIRAEVAPAIQQYNERYMMVTPESGDLLIFPPWVTHHVEPNPTPINRISISFNAFLKK